MAKKTDKLLVLGIDGLDPRLTQKYLDEGKMPNTKKFLERGAAQKRLEMIGGQPTVTPPMWTTLATGANPCVHGITGYYRRSKELDTVEYNFDSTNCHAEQMWNVTAEAGLKTLVWHWPGSSWPPSSDNPNLYVVDGTQPGGPNIGTAEVEGEMLLVASVKTEEVMFKNKAAADSRVPCFESGMEIEENHGDSAYDRIHSQTVKRVTITREENITNLSATPFDIVFSPIKPAKNWVSAPADALECTLLLSKGLIRRPCLVLKNDAGEYDRLAVYKNKKETAPIVTLEKDVYTADIVDEAIKNDDRLMVNRNMRLLEIEPDGSSLRLWVSAAMDFHNDAVWHPKSLLKEITENVGYPQPICLAGGADERLISKCMKATWDKAGQWNADSIKYLAESKGFDVIFSHFHNVDMQGHMLVKYLKNGNGDYVSPETCQKLFEDVYVQTDDYIGYFLEMLDDGWTIIIVSDHGQVCPEHGQNLGLIGGTSITAVDMVDLGYTVLQKDEDGNPTHEIDWSKTTAVISSMNHIYINLKGRELHGIVDPADQYELEERIMTDLYGLRDEKTGHRLVALALRNRDAELLGTGGPDGGDIIFYVTEGYNFDHADCLSTIDGACDTSVRSVFMAAGPGIKENYLTDRTVRHVDVTPTVAALLDVRMPAQCEGAPVYQIIE